MTDPTGTNGASGTAGGPPTGTAAGDLSGTFPNPTVAKVNGTAVGPGATAAAGQLPGTATNDAGAAGNTGEYSLATLPLASAIVLATGTAANITSLQLTAGDWNVWGQAVFSVGTITVVTSMNVGVSATSAVQPVLGSGARTQVGLGAGLTGIADTAVGVGPMRLSLAATATAFLVGTLAFSTSTASVYGSLQARRAR